MPVDEAAASCSVASTLLGGPSTDVTDPDFDRGFGGGRSHAPVNRVGGLNFAGGVRGRGVKKTLVPRKRSIAARAEPIRRDR